MNSLERLIQEIKADIVRLSVTNSIDKRLEISKTIVNLASSVKDVKHIVYLENFNSEGK